MCAPEWWIPRRAIPGEHDDRDTPWRWPEWQFEPPQEPEQQNPMPEPVWQMPPTQETLQQIPVPRQELPLTQQRAQQIAILQDFVQDIHDNNECALQSPATEEHTHHTEVTLGPNQTLTSPLRSNEFLDGLFMSVIPWHLFAQARDPHGSNVPQIRPYEPRTEAQRILMLGHGPSMWDGVDRRLPIPGPEAIDLSLWDYEVTFEERMLETEQAHATMEQDAEQDEQDDEELAVGLERPGSENQEAQG